MSGKYDEDLGRDLSVEFRSIIDDAWYPISVFHEGQTLRIKFYHISGDYDHLFQLDHFRTFDDLSDFKARFRPLSKQLQDNQCRHLIAKGVRVCASHQFNRDDVRFYDALVHAVQETEHTEAEVCSCTFKLLWLHGPIAGNLTDARIEDICILQPAMDLDPAVASFLKMARERTQSISTHSASKSKGVSGLGFFEPLRKGNPCARRSVKVCSPEVNFNNMEEEVEDVELFKWGKKRGMGGKKNDVQFYESFTYNGVNYKLSDSVYVYYEESEEAEPCIGRLIKIWQNRDQSKKVKVQWFYRPRDICEFLEGKKTFDNELFLACGDGPALASVIPLEAVAGKCNVICISKETRNPQPSPQELKMADFVSYRFFDVGQCKVLYKLDDKIAGKDDNFNNIPAEVEMEAGLEFKWGKKRGTGGKKNDVQFYESFTYNGVDYTLFDSVCVYNDGKAEPYIGKLIKIWENHDKLKTVKVQWFFRPREIRNYLEVKEVLDNELFLACGEGFGVANVIPLESVAGKCNVICISKDIRNPQPSDEVLKMADFVFYRFFDVGHCKILDKIDDKIAGNGIDSIGLVTLATNFNHLKI